MYLVFTGMSGESWIYLGCTSGEFIHLVFTRMPAESDRGSSGLCCCVCV